MKKCLIFTTICFLICQFALASCNDTRMYPIEIENLGLQKQYDNSKWSLYCIFCDWLVDPVKKVSGNYVVVPNEKKITYGQLDLCFDEVRIKNDTIEITFSFLYDGKKVTSLNVNKPPYQGTVFIGNSDVISMYIPGGVDMQYIWVHCPDKNDCTDRRAKPLQPEVKRYIQENKTKINSWFKDQALKKGVFKK